MNVKSHDIGQCPKLERTFFQIFRQQIGEADLNTVSGIRPDDQRLCTDLPTFNLADIGIQPAMTFQILFQNEKASLWLVPAKVVVDNLCLNQSDFKYLDGDTLTIITIHTAVSSTVTFGMTFTAGRAVPIGMAGTGVGIKGAWLKTRNKVGFFQWRGFNLIAAIGIQDAKGWLQGRFAKGSVDKIRIARMQSIFPGRSLPILQGQQRRDRSSVRKPSLPSSSRS